MPLTNASKSLLLTVYEYLAVTVPVVLYISLEAAHEKRWQVLFTSPKWSVATIFLLFQGLLLYVKFLEASGGKVSLPTVGIFGLVALSLTVYTIINAWLSLDPQENSHFMIGSRLAVLTLVSLGFSIAVWAARFYQMEGASTHAEGN